MKNTVLAAMLSLAFLGTGCLNTDPLEPEIIIDPVELIRVSHDTITAGGHLGVEIAANAEQVYTSLQKIQTRTGLQYVNVVSNIFTNVNQLDNRIHLYQSILLDEQKGTDSGIQITFEAGKVKSIYLNSGSKLTQWPLKENASTSVRIGDQANGLYSKLVNIQGKSSYANKFERISLFTKELASEYDPIMTQSPQWYFRFTVEPKLFEHVDIKLENGKVKYLVVSRYKDPS
ncbi:hypothetical protein [Dyadobacter sp. CY312]|uniref:hypothetical protein n=1 Tax=Dyadobacter sp. CY312 TaxID=2907303 RepID=UPI001F1A47CD|nr:hypothetical protein [Dyadobacter sp. CY312]MCE7041792.1 hypothetical protein [Dyadobacter sp. CY312]